MNRNTFCLKTTVLLLTLLCNGVSFGMKRSFDQISTTKETSENQQQKPTLKEYCDQSLDFCMPSLSIELLKTKISNENLSSISADKKINYLRRIDFKRRDEIDKMQASRYKTFCSLPEDLAKKIIYYETQKIKKQILCNEKIAEDAFIKSCGIDTESQEWQDVLRQLQAKEEFNISSMKQPRNDTMWSCDLPLNLVTKLTSVMQENKFDPTAFYVKSSEKNNSFNGAFMTPKPILISKKEYKYQNGVAGCFSFSPFFVKATNGQVSFIVNHEMTHVLQNHSTRRSFFVDTIAQIKGIDYNTEILPTCEYAQYQLAQEITADTMAALKNPEIARHSNECTLYPNSYGILKTINIHLDVLEYFDKKESNNIAIAQDSRQSS